MAIALTFAIGASAHLPTYHAVGLLLFLAGAMIALRILELTDAEKLGLDYVAEVRLALFDGLTSNTAHSSHGLAMTRLMNDLSSLKNWVGLGLARLFVGALAFVGIVTAASLYSLPHALAILIATVPVLMVALLLHSPLKRRIKEVRRRRGRLASSLGEVLLGLGLLRRLGQVGRSRTRVDKRSRALIRALEAKIRVAASLRSLPEALLPFVVICAIGFEISVSTDSIGLLLLAGLAIGPVRNALRAMEYRTVFVVARDRLKSGLGCPPQPLVPNESISDEGPAGVVPVPGPIDVMWDAIKAEGYPVTQAAPILSKSLRRNIDLTRRFRGNDAELRRIAQLCGILDKKCAPRGLDTRLSPEVLDISGLFRAKLELARALAFGAKSLSVNAPVLLLEQGGRTLLNRLSEQFGLRIKLLVGDLDCAGSFGESDPESSSPTAANDAGSDQNRLNFQSSRKNLKLPSAILD